MHLTIAIVSKFGRSLATLKRRVHSVMLSLSHFEHGSIWSLEFEKLRFCPLSTFNEYANSFKFLYNDSKYKGDVNELYPL